MTLYPAYLEPADDGTGQAYAIELPGCMSLGAASDAALAALAKAIRAYYVWLAEHGETGETMLPHQATIKAVVDVPAGERPGASQGRLVSRLVGQSIDGKELRGARAHGRPSCLVSLLRHDSGTVLGQRAVDRKSNEIKAVPPLLQEQDLIRTKGWANIAAGARHYGAFVHRALSLISSS